MTFGQQMRQHEHDGRLDDEHRDQHHEEKLPRLDDLLNVFDGEWHETPGSPFAPQEESGSVQRSRFVSEPVVDGVTEED